LWVFTGRIRGGIELAVVEGVQDVTDLVTFFAQNYGKPHHVYLVGASEGGLVTTLAVEQRPDVFSGGLATCGPIGDFRQQINYWGDVRAVFDYFFPTVFPFTAVDIPADAYQAWDTIYVPRITQAIQSNPHATEQLLKVTRAATDPDNPASIAETVIGILWYNIFATNDGKTELGGQPFDNTRRLYLGSDNDIALNRGVKRYKADSTALTNIARYSPTSGRLKSPLVTLHTTGDPIVPYWHEPLYRLKVLSRGSGLRYTNIPVFRYGHCNFKASEVLVGFAWLTLQVTGRELLNAQAALPDAGSQAEFLRLAREYGAMR
jgi:pimeloyl-ACP methyl ester carboxylesterase